MTIKAVTKRDDESTKVERRMTEPARVGIEVIGETKEDEVVMVLMPASTFEAFKALGLKLNMTPTELMNAGLRNLLTKVEKEGVQSIAREEKR